MSPARTRFRRRTTALTAVALGLAAMTAGATTSAQAADAPNQIVNGGFDDGLSSWVAYPAPSVIDGQGCIDVPAHAGAYAAALDQTIPIVQDETYTLSFKAKITPGLSGTIRAVIQGGEDVNYAQALPEKALDLTSEQKTYSYTFTSAIALAKGDLLFQQSTDNDAAYQLCVDDVSLLGGQEPEVYKPDTGPRVRVNQVGYLPFGPKNATLVTESTDPIDWKLVNKRGITVAHGKSTPKGVDPSAAENVQLIDFSGYKAEGTGFTLVADGETSFPFSIKGDLYEKLRKDSKTFFYTNRSGIAISDDIAPGYGRAAGHVGVAPNKGDTAVPCQSLDDDSQKILDEPWTCDYTTDVTGGWYDAGDHGKYVVNGGISVAQLMQEFERTKYAPSADKGKLGDTTLRVPETGNKVPDVLDEARWELEWLLKMQVKPGKPLAGMAFHKVADVDWTGLPLDPAADPQVRVLYRPSTAATLNLAAAAAQGSRLFKPYDADFSAKLLAAARTAYAAAKANPAIYAPAANGALDPNPGSGPYDDKNVTDEFYWAASELYITTGRGSYAADVVGSPLNTADIFTPGGFGWADTAALGRLDLATVPNGIAGRTAIKKSVIDGADKYLAAQDGEPFGQAYAPDGGNYSWGSNSAILNNLQVIGTAYDLTKNKKYSTAVEKSADYLLGRNALNISYVTGYGTVFSQNQHSRLYAHESDAKSPHPPAGTVAGGPNSTAASTGDPIATPLFKGCAAQFCYIDDNGSWSTNEITINWNAPLSWVASFLADQDDGR